MIRPITGSKLPNMQILLIYIFECKDVVLQLDVLLQVSFSQSKRECSFGTDLLVQFCDCSKDVQTKR